MTITKFNSASPSGYTRTDVFTQVPLVMGFWVTIANTQGGTDEIRLFDGDYIVQDDNGKAILYLSAAQYISDLAASNLIRECIGKELIRSIWAALRASALPDAQKGGIATTITPVMVMILTGETVAGRALASSTGTNANYTAGVKTALLALMDTAITKL